MRALDLFCCAGGATRGLQLAGYHVTGVDIAAQPAYCGDAFVQADVLELDPTWIRTFDLVWASPPCQRFTAYRRRDPARVGADALNLIPQTRALLHASGVPRTIIENVPGAPLERPVLLCGSMFGLAVRRHRHFECSFRVVQPPCNHAAQQGSYPQATNRKNRRKTVEIGVWRIPLDVQQAAMGGLDWMPLDRLSQAIPPAYSAYLAMQSGEL